MKATASGLGTVPKDVRDDWMAKLPAGQFRLLFETLPGTLFFAKDREGRLMSANPSFVRRAGMKTEEEIIGLTDEDLFSPKLATKYRGDDLRVMETGAPLFGIMELFPDDDGQPDWCVTDKLPLRDNAGKVCGVCGTVRSYEGTRAALMPYLELAPVADYIHANYTDSLDAVLLASKVNMSVRQLERKFHKTFQVSPRGYLIKTRVLAACRLLRETEMQVTQIAQEVGFFDHSDLSRQFRKVMGQSPSEYRKRKFAKE